MNILTSLIVYQGASVAIRADDEGMIEVGVEGTLTITVAGTEHVLTAQRMTVADVLRALETKYLHHDWTTAPVVEVRGGVAEVASGDAVSIDFDNLASGRCPACNGDLEYPWDIENGECPSCHYVWTKEDE